MIRRYIKKVREHIIESVKSAKGYIYYIVCILFTVGLCEYYVTQNKILFALNLLILTIYAAIRCFYRKKNKFSGIEIQSRTIQCDKNKKMHAKEFLDICILLAVILLALAVFFWLDTGYKALNGCVAAMIVFAALFCIAAHYSVVYDNVLIKSITILFSTMQGAMVLVVIFSMGLMLLETGLLMFNNSDAEILILQDAVQSGKPIILEVAVVAIWFIEKCPIVIAFEIGFTTILLTLYVCILPPYQLNKLQLSFQVVNIIMVLVGVVSFLFSGEIANYINEPKEMSEFLKSYDAIKEIGYCVGKEEINTMLSAVVLPYTFAILIVNICIQKKKEISGKRTNDILERIKISEEIDYDELEELKKEYYYYAGDRRTLTLYCENCDVIKQMKELRCEIEQIRKKPENNPTAECNKI